MNQMSIIPQMLVVRRSAIWTLFRVVLVVEVFRFSFASIVRALGRQGDAKELLLDLEWLVEHKLLSRSSAYIYELTPEGLDLLRSTTRN